MTEVSVLQRIRRHPFAAQIGQSSAERTVHAVGGIVRDAILGLDSADLDLSVSDQGELLARRIAETSGGTLIALGGDRFAAYRVVSGKIQADVWDRDGKSLTSDLERRDLTINSIACPLDGHGSLEDPFGGLEDLSSRTLRATKMDCFDRDPLRVLRLIRFELTLEGFVVDPATASAAQGASGGLTRVATERVRDELERILELSPTARAFETLQELKALEALVPTTSRDAVARSLLEWGRRLDLALAIVEADSSADAALRKPAGPADRRQAALTLLALSAGDGDLDDGVAKLGTEGLATRGTLARARRLFSGPLPSTEDERRLFLDRHRHDWRLALAVSAAARVDDDAIDPQSDFAVAISDLTRTAQASPDLVHGMPTLVDGHHAARILDLAPGPELGAALRALKQAQALGQVGSPAEAERFLRKRDQTEPTWPKPADAD